MGEYFGGVHALTPFEALRVAAAVEHTAEKLHLLSVLNADIQSGDDLLDDDDEDTAAAFERHQAAATAEAEDVTKLLGEQHALEDRYAALLEAARARARDRNRGLAWLLDEKRNPDDDAAMPNGETEELAAVRTRLKELTGRVQRVLKDAQGVSGDLWSKVQRERAALVTLLRSTVRDLTTGAARALTAMYAFNQDRHRTLHALRRALATTATTTTTTTTTGGSAAAGGSAGVGDGDGAGGGGEAEGSGDGEGGNAGAGTAAAATAAAGDAHGYIAALEEKLQTQQVDGREVVVGYSTFHGYVSENREKRRWATEMLERERRTAAEVRRLQAALEAERTQLETEQQERARTIAAMQSDLRTLAKDTATSYATLVAESSAHSETSRRQERSAIRTLEDRVESRRLDLDRERHAHADVVAHLRTSAQNLQGEIERWMGRYETEIEDLETRLQVKRQEKQAQEESIQSAEGEMEAETKAKARREAERVAREEAERVRREREMRREMAAAMVQARWRAYRLRNAKKLKKVLRKPKKGAKGAKGKKKK